MGVTRKLLSTVSGGLVDFRSDKERIARKTAKGARAQKKANRIAKAELKELKRRR